MTTAIDQVQQELPDNPTLPLVAAELAQPAGNEGIKDVEWLCKREPQQQW